MSIAIRLVDSLEAIEQFRQVEHLIWNEPLEVTIPAHVIVTTLHNGGGLLAAYAEDGPAATGGMVGITYWWPGLARAGTAGALRLKMCSHMAGVLPPWRGTGLGLRLKLAQAAVIRDQGMTDWVTWTYDPLIRTNGVFNLHRLGALCSTYHPNLYGEMPDGINAGLPSDRCQVDWWLASERVRQRSRPDWRDESHPPPDAQMLTAGESRCGFAMPPSALLLFDGRPLALPLPADIFAIRRADQGLGQAWQQWMRAALQPAFAAGYVLNDCRQHEDGAWRYWLARKIDP